MTKLIALAVIAAGAVPGIDTEILKGATFEVAPELADQLVTDGKAKPADATATKERAVKARLLIDCEHGRCNDVVTLPVSVVSALVDSGAADDDKGAVGYAMSLPQNQPKSKA